MFPIAAIGHVNPLLAIVGALAARPDVVEVRCFGPGEVAGAFRAAGASHVVVDAAPVDVPEGGPSALAAKSFLWPLGVVDACLEQVRAFAPDVVLYDVFCVFGAVGAGLLGVPSAAVVTMPGYGSLGEQFVVAHGSPHPLLAAANDRYRESAGVDLLADGQLPALFPSGDLSIVTVAEALATPIDPARSPRLAALLSRFEKTCEYVGSCVGPVRLAPRAMPPFPFDVLDAARRDGRRVVLFSLGTVLTDFRFDSPVGGAPTGRDFLVTLLRHVVGAFADDPEFVVVVSPGSRLPADEQPAWPGNFVVRTFLPQVELLARYADVFLTHHGMNSTTESILAGVPMVSLPGAGDQIPNAATAARHGVAMALWDLADPYRTCDAALLRRAVRTVVDEPSYRENCRRLGAALRRGGGPARAAELVVGLAV